MNLAKSFGISALLLAAIGSQAVGQEDVKKMPAPDLIRDLNAPDGPTRVAATAELSRRGNEVLPDLKKAGAKQIAPFGTIGSSRLDAVYSLIEGLPPNPPGGRGGYLAGSFGLMLEKATIAEEVAQMGKKHGFALSGVFRADSIPSCYVTLAPGKSLADVLRRVLMTESKVVSVSLNYFER